MRLEVSSESSNLGTLATETSDIWSLQSALKATDTARPLVFVDTTVQIYITRGEAEHSTEHVSGKHSA
jgi:hypothetical protein